jgi:opacity protein-like surface antigen
MIKTTEIGRSKMFLVGEIAMKKIFAIMIVATAIGAMAFAQEETGKSGISVRIGIGGDFSWINSSFQSNLPESKKLEMGEPLLADTKTSVAGFFVFFDSKYLLPHLGFKDYTVSAPGLETKTQSYFDIGLTWKYPFTINQKIILFPSLGFEMRFFTKSKSSSATRERSDIRPNNYIDRSTINVGVGADYYLTNNIFLRGQFEWRFMLNNQAEKDLTSEIDSAGYDLRINQNGPALKIAIGYAFDKKDNDNAESQ